MKGDAGETIRYYMIEWNGVSCFWWYRDQIVCSGADQAQIGRLLSIAAALIKRLRRGRRWREIRASVRPSLVKRKS